MDESLAERLFKEGFKSISTIASADAGALTAVPGVDEKAAQTWIDEAGRILAGEPGGGNA
ncbi:MAG: helix-hairpin-helix domain-containing protein [Syntrophaceae bacterium]